MRYLLDTNICIYFLNRRSEYIIQQLRKIPPQDIWLCSIVKAELWYGAIKSARKVENLERLEEFFEGFLSLAFDEDAIHTYGEIRAQVERDGAPVGPNDLFIAAIAKANNLVLLTHNSAEFQHIDGLEVKDWGLDEDRTSLFDDQ
jgi:tRNA(fMet)-specific endonuclease VapC